MVAGLAMVGVFFLVPSRQTEVKSVGQNQNDYLFQLPVTSEFDLAKGWEWQRPLIDVRNDGKWEALGANPTPGSKSQKRART